LTGTAFAGKVAIDDELYLSNGQKVRVKNIHAQNEQSTEGLAGQRLALNINLDFDRTLIERGDWLFSQPSAKATDRVTVWLENQIPLNESQPVHIYPAASHPTGKLTLLQQPKLAPQQHALAELILEQPLFLTHGDKIILRNSNSTAVLGGAKVIEIHSPKRHKRTEARFDYLRQLIQVETAEKRTALYLQNHAVEAEQLMWIEQLTNTQLNDILEKNGDIRFQSWCFNADYRTQQTSKLLTALAQYHEQHPDQLGLGKARLYRIAALNQPEKLIYHFIDELLAENQLQQTRGWLHTADHKIQFNAQERALWQQVLEQFEQHNGQALWVRDLAGLLGQEESAMRNFLYKAGKLGYLTAVVKDRFFLTVSSLNRHRKAVTFGEFLGILCQCFLQAVPISNLVLIDGLDGITIFQACHLSSTSIGYLDTVGRCILNTALNKG